jgi:hypothetical protein
MSKDLDKSLLDRLNALRGNSAGQDKPISTEYIIHNFSKVYQLMSF